MKRLALSVGLKVIVPAWISTAASASRRLMMVSTSVPLMLCPT
nr:MAG TPA: hypothetical protein [Caudoviricetes sp.]